MKKFSLISFLFPLLFTLSCNGQPGVDKHAPTIPPPAAQIDEYVVAAFEDSKGNLWFGTMMKGAACWDGKTLTYLSETDGLVGNTVTSFAEDKNGVLWIGTHSGLSRYDGLTITNFTPKNGLCYERVSHLLIDRSGKLWVGAWGGVCFFNGNGFTDFPLPVPDVELQPYQNTMNWVTEILEDRQGNIWFGRDGYGACKYDGRSFTHYTKKDGLASNNVQAIQEDRQGKLWFGSRVAENDHADPQKRSGDGGLSRFDGKTFERFPDLEGLSRNDVYTIYTDKKGNVWIGAVRVGLYRYDGSSFSIYKGTDRMDLTHVFGVQAILEDRKGALWLGFSGGLFRLEGSSIINVTQNGPWE